MGIIKVAIVDEHGSNEAEVEEDTHLLDSILPQFQGDQFHCLRFIDLSATRYSIASKCSACCMSGVRWPV